jgi:ribosomal RNA assembly protein
VKEYIQKKLSVELEIESETGKIVINLKKDATDPSLLFKAKDTVLAIGRGFSPERAYRLLEDDYNMLVIIDLREILGRSQLNIKRVKGRIIGKEGKTRRIVEEMTEAYVSVYGHTVAILGGIEQAEIARGAISLIIKGSRHATVYKYLQRKKGNLKKQKLELWEGSPLLPEEK